MRARIRDNGLSLAFGVLLLLALVGQALTGRASYNNDALTHGLQEISLARYVTSAEFGVDVAENWQSEYLQFILFILLTVWLVQRGSPESKEVDKAGRESDKQQRVGAYARPDSPRWASAGGLRQWALSNSLVLVMGAAFLLSMLAQLVAGCSAYNAEQLADLEAPLAWTEYLWSADYWNRTLQNWQSEFLAVGSMVVLSIYLRQRGSPESKPVGASHESTGIEG